MSDRRNFLKQAGALAAISWQQFPISAQVNSPPQPLPKAKWVLTGGRVHAQVENKVILKSLLPGYRAGGVWMPARNLAAIQNRSSYMDKTGPGSAIALTCELGQIRGTWLLINYDDGTLGCQLELGNNTSQPIILDRYSPLMTSPGEGSIQLSGDPAEWRVYVDSGRCGGKCASYGLTDNDGQNVAGAVSVLWSPAEDQALAIGQVEVERSWTDILYEYGGRGKNNKTYHWAYTKNVTLRLDQDAIGYRLDPGETLKLDLCTVIYDPNPFHALIRFRDEMVAFNHVRNFTKADAWVGWMTWYNQETHLRGGFGATGTTCASQAVTLEQSRFIANTGLQSYGLKDIAIDDGYQRNVHLGDWLQSTPEFPNGMKGLSEELKKIEMTPGVWIAPFVATEDSFVYQHHPEWFVLYSFDWYHAGPPVRAYEFDPTAPGALEWLLNVFRTFQQWGYSFFKNDFSGGLISSEGKQYHNQKQTGLMRWRWAWRNIKEALGGDKTCSIQLCGANNIGALGIVDSVRTGSDVVPCVGERQWQIIKEDTATTGVNRWWQNKHFFICDPDNLEVAEYRNYRLYADQLDCESKWALSFDEARVRAALVVAVGGNIILGDRLTLLEPEKIAIIKKTLPLFGESAIPLDMFEQTTPCLWWHHIEKPWGSWEVLSVVNFGEASLVKEVPLSRMGINREQRVIAWELWEQKQHQTIQEGVLRIAVKPHSIKTLRFTAIDEHRSALVGSSFHITMGAVEIVDVSTAGSTGIAVRIARPAPEEGECCFWSAREQAVKTIGLKVGPHPIQLRVD